MTYNVPVDVIFREMDSSQDRFLVVDLDDGVELVPDFWVSRDGQWVLFPKTTSFKALRTAVYLRETPKRSWHILPIIKILDSSTDYVDGRNKLEDYVFGGHAIAMLATEAGKSKINCVEGDKNCEIMTDVEERLCPDNICCSADVPPSELLPDPAVTLTVSNTPVILEDKPQCSVFKRPSTSQESEQDTSQFSTDFETQIWQYFTDIKRTLDSVSQRMDTISQKLDLVLESQGRRLISQNTVTGSLDLDNYDSVQLRIKLPVKSNTELINLEAELEDERIHRILVSKLKRIGGKDTKSIVVRILRYLMANSVAEKYSWLGAKGKKVFSSLRRIWRAIEETVRSQKPSTTDAELTLILQNWLRHAKYRNIREKEQMGTNRAGSQLIIKEECS